MPSPFAGRIAGRRPMVAADLIVRILLQEGRQFTLRDRERPVAERCVDNPTGVPIADCISKPLQVCPPRHDARSKNNQSAPLAFDRPSKHVPPLDIGSQPEIECAGGSEMGSDGGGAGRKIRRELRNRFHLRRKDFSHRHARLSPIGPCKHLGQPK